MLDKNLVRFKYALCNKLYYLVHDEKSIGSFEIFVFGELVNLTPAISQLVYIRRPMIPGSRPHLSALRLGQPISVDGNVDPKSIYVAFHILSERVRRSCFINYTFANTFPMIPQSCDWHWQQLFYLVVHKVTAKLGASSHIVPGPHLLTESSVTRLVVANPESSLKPPSWTLPVAAIIDWAAPHWSFSDHSPRVSSNRLLEEVRSRRLS